MSHSDVYDKKRFMNPPLRHKSARAIQTVRSLFAAATLALGLSGLASTANAMPTPEALSSWKGLSEQIDFGQSIRDRLVQAGMDAIGTPYLFGGSDEDGFDCSGLVAFVYKEIAGMELPRRATDQRKEGKKVSRDSLEPGDLVFFATTRRKNVVSHVGIYIGDKKFVHAPSRGSSVRVDDLEDNAYWSKRYLGARAYVKPEHFEAKPTLVAQNSK